MKRLVCAVFAVFLLCGCIYSPEPESTVPTRTACEVTQLNIPGFDPWLMMESMTTPELVGQLFLARCPSDETAVADIQTFHLGGYVLFGRDFKDHTAASVTSTIHAYQNAANTPLLIAVDEEGGTVCRVSSQPLLREEPFPSPRELYAEGGNDLLVSTEQEKCELLSSLGINVNIAPVCDITQDPEAFMYERSLGLSPELTGSCVANMVDMMNRNKIGSVLKHFPGYGNNTDTHTQIALDERSLADLKTADLVPFSYGINAGCGAILVSHTIVTCLDAEQPASLSPAVVAFIRHDMGFDGVIMTDDLDMDAITQRYGAGESAVLAVLAGNDLLCSTHYQQQYDAVLDAVENGRITLDHIRKSVARILLWKYELGLLQPNA